jgi:Tol biopolymer transport system component
MTHAEAETAFTFMADVYVYDPAEGKSRRLSPGDGVYYQPCIRPDGRYVVFTGASEGAPRVWQGDVATGELVALTPEDSGARHPAYSWDGEKIVFASDRASGQAPENIRTMPPSGVPPEGLPIHLYMMDADGSNVRQLTSGDFQDQRPTLSPEGGQVAFVSNRSGVASIWVLDLDDGSEPRQLVKEASYRPWYDRHGDTLYFFTFESSTRHQIHRVSLPDGVAIPLENDDRGLSHGPYYDQFNDVLLMHSTRDGKFQLWEMGLNGEEPTLVDIPGFDRATHPTRGSNGVIAFDVGRKP